MSPSGALLEGVALPGAGSRISLKRGQLHGAGSVAWSAGRRAGVRLDCPIHVSDWMARQGSAGQARVDAMIANVRAASVGPDASPTPTCVPSTADGDPISVEAQLAELRADLAELERALIEDPIVVATHPEIQTIDISIQRIDRIMRRLGES